MRNHPAPPFNHKGRPQWNGRVAQVHLNFGMAPGRHLTKDKKSSVNPDQSAKELFCSNHSEPKWWTQRSIFTPSNMMQRQSSERTSKTSKVTRAHDLMGHSGCDHARLALFHSGHLGWLPSLRNLRFPSNCDGSSRGGWMNPELLINAHTTVVFRHSHFVSRQSHDVWRQDDFV